MNHNFLEESREIFQCAITREIPERVCLVDGHHIYNWESFEHHRARCVADGREVTNPMTNATFRTCHGVPALEPLCRLLRDSRSTPLSVWVESRRLRDSEIPSVVTFCALAKACGWFVFVNMVDPLLCLRYLPLNDTEESVSLVHAIHIRRGVDMHVLIRATIQDVLLCGGDPAPLVGHVYLHPDRDVLVSLYCGLVPSLTPVMDSPMMTSLVSRSGYGYAVAIFCAESRLVYPSQVRALRQLYSKMSMRFAVEYEERVVHLLVRSMVGGSERLCESANEFIADVICTV